MSVDAKSIIEVIAALTVPITIVSVVWHRVKSEMGMGYRALQYLAIGVVLPVVLILGLEGVIDGNGISAIVGGIVGYLFTSAVKESK